MTASRAIGLAPAGRPRDRRVSVATGGFGLGAVAIGRTAFGIVAIGARGWGIIPLTGTVVRLFRRGD